MTQVSGNIRTNLITGFLGVGKTTAILKLLAQHDKKQKWAVLVNEFGEIGIDGALLANSGIAIKEVPGGCMCCTAGVPTRVALNQLIRSAKPTRILIEPTGLGHPANILAMLRSEDYADVLDVRATLTLVDPRVLDNPRYTGNENFIGQVEAADALIAAKHDLCSDEQLKNFSAWAQAVKPQARVMYLQDGLLQHEWLDLPCGGITATNVHPSHSLLLTPQFSTTHLPDNQPVLRRQHQAGDFFSCGWIFSADLAFDFEKLFALLNNLDVLRAKAVMKTDRGTFAFNLLEGSLTVNELPARNDSRIEFIAPEAINWDMLEEWLLQTQKTQ